MTGSWFSAKFLAYAFFSWLVPVVLSCAFFDQQGELTVGMAEFKSAMMGICSVFGAVMYDYVLTGVLSSQEQPVVGFTRTALEIGLYFVIANSVLDILLLRPLINSSNKNKPNYRPMTVKQWFSQIGIGYVSIVAQAWLAGRLVDRALEEKRF